MPESRKNTRAKGENKCFNPMVYARDYILQLYLRNRRCTEDLNTRVYGLSLYTTVHKSIPPYKHILRVCYTPSKYTPEVIRKLKKSI